MPQMPIELREPAWRDEMTVPIQALADAATRLHAYLVETHWNGRALQGPDYGIRFNARVGRFIKSYASFMPWSDNYVYNQAQRYWILANWLISDLGLADRETCQEMAIACSEFLLSTQRREGYWEYPNPEWKHRIATVEGNYAVMGLLETYLRTGRQPLLDGAKRWCRYVAENVGFQDQDGRLAVNYFAHTPGSMVSNNSASALSAFARMAKATDDDQYSDSCNGMVAFLRDAQLETGELPYALMGPHGKSDRIHFLCYQYNAFQFFNLADYYRLTEDRAILPVLEGIARFVSRGVLESGAARYDCPHEHPEVSYYTAALAAALSLATALGLGDYRSLADRAYRRVLSQQRRDGGMAFFSRKNYGFLTDRRSYPRSQVMILYHLLQAFQMRTSITARSVENGSNNKVANYGRPAQRG